MGSGTRRITTPARCYPLLVPAARDDAPVEPLRLVRDGARIDVVDALGRRLCQECGTRLAEGRCDRCDGPVVL